MRAHVLPPGPHRWVSQAQSSRSVGWMRGRWYRSLVDGHLVAEGQDFQLQSTGVSENTWRERRGEQRQQGAWLETSSLSWIRRSQCTSVKDARERRTCQGFQRTRVFGNYRKRDLRTASAFLNDLARRLVNRVQLSSDALSAYVEATEQAFGPMSITARSSNFTRPNPSDQADTGRRA